VAEIEDPKSIGVSELADLYRELEDEPISEVLPKYGISAADLLAAEDSVLMALEAELRTGGSSPLARRLRKEPDADGPTDAPADKQAIWDEATSHDGAVPAPAALPVPAVEAPGIPQKPSFMRFGPSALQTPPPLPATPHVPAVDPTVPTVQTPTLMSPLPPAAIGVLRAQSITPSTTELATPQVVPVAATPFRPLPSEALGFTLERFAALEAALLRSDASRPAVLGQYSIDEAGYGRVSAHWQAEIAAHPPLASELSRLVSAARDAEGAGVGARGGTVAMETPADPSATIRAQGAAVPELTVDQYAWVTATLRRAGAGGRAEALSRLRLTEASYQELDTQWRAAFTAKPELKHAFITCLAKHFP